MSQNRVGVTIDIPPWFKDHSFGGRTILPAVETMLLLASRVEEFYPGTDVRVMEDVHFAKFFEIPDGVTELSALIEWTVSGDGRIQGKLLSRIQMKAMSRIREHGEISFPPAEPRGRSMPDVDPAPPADSAVEIPAEQIYRDLVPFGPAYQTLQGMLLLSEDRAWGRLKSPDFPLAKVSRKTVGSPFPLDGALHAASVLGQQSVEFIPFPVGFDRRIIVRPTAPGCGYITRVVSAGTTRQELIFDLTIFDNDGLVYEIVSGVRMRDVSGVAGEAYFSAQVSSFSMMTLVSQRRKIRE